MGPVSARTVATSNAPSIAGSAYTALSPTRLLDTRTSGQTLGAGGSLNLTVTGVSGVPSTATAVALNVTIAATDGGRVTDSSYLSVYPTGGSQNGISNLNWVTGETVPNSVIVPVGTNGQVTIYNHTGLADVVVDLQGYFAPESPVASTAGAYVPLTPARIADTRLGSGYPNAGSTLGANSSLNIQVTGAGGVPAGASGAVLNVTVTDTTDASYLLAYPAGATKPTASNLNWTAGETVASRVLASLSSTGMITVYNHTGSTDVVVDVSGYFTNGTTALPSNASLYYATTPARITDTRAGSGYPNAGSTLGAGASLPVQVTGEGGIPTLATSAVLNVTATDTTAASFFTVFPGGSTPPIASLTSDVNWSAGGVVPNLTVATLNATTGAIGVFNHAGNADLVIDTFGFFYPFALTPPGITPPPPASFYAITAVASPATIPANGTSTSSVTATVTGKNLAPVTGDMVQFTLTGTGCGTFTAPSTGTTVYDATLVGGTTPPQTYTSSTTAGTCTVSVVEANQAQTNTTTITQTPVGYAISVSGSPSTMTVGSSQISLITATVTFNGAPVTTDTVTFTEGIGNPSTACGTLSPTSAVTNASGQASVNYLNTATTVGFCPITATESIQSKAATTYMTEDSNQSTANAITVSASPATIPANGAAAASSVVALVTGAGGSAVSGDEVMGQWAGDCGFPNSTAPNFGTTDAFGTVTQSYTASSTAGTCTVTVTEANSGVSATTTITQTPTVYAVSVTATPSTITANGITTSTITATVTNTTGGVAPGDTVTFSDLGGGNPAAACGSLSPVTAITNGAGVATVTYVSSTTAGFCTVTGTEGVTSASGSAAIDQTSV